MYPIMYINSVPHHVHYFCTPSCTLIMYPIMYITSVPHHVHYFCTPSCTLLLYPITYIIYFFAVSVCSALQRETLPLTLLILFSNLTNLSKTDVRSTSSGVKLGNLVMSMAQLSFHFILEMQCRYLLCLTSIV